MSNLEITGAKYLDSYQLEVSFNDGKIVTVDFEPFLIASSHPEIRKYLNIDLFKRFNIVDGDLDWNDFDC